MNSDSHSSLHLSTVELTLKHSAVNYFAAMIFPHPSLNFGLLHPQRITLSSQPGSLIISHLWLVGRTRPWELGWFELCYRARLSSADTVNRSFLKVILTFNTVMNNRQGSTENSKYMEKTSTTRKLLSLWSQPQKCIYIFAEWLVHQGPVDSNFAGPWSFCKTLNRILGCSFF